jgi:hypothetical protein
MHIFIVYSHTLFYAVEVEAEAEEVIVVETDLVVAHPVAILVADIAIHALALLMIVEVVASLTVLLLDVTTALHLDGLEEVRPEVLLLFPEEALMTIPQDVKIAATVGPPKSLFIFP